MYRSSAGDLGHYDDPPRRPERWDRDRFERAGGGRRDFDDKESFHFSEHSRNGRNRHIDIEIDERERRDRRGPPVAERERERERFYESDRFGPPRRHRTDLIDEPTASEVANRALAPYRRKSVVDREVDIAIRRPARPQYIRRQSSLDTFDRRPLPRYGDVEREERDEWRPPTNVPIPLPIRERRRSPERRRFHEEEYENIRYRDSSPREREEYREVEVRREKSTHRRSRSRAGSRAGSRAAKSVAHSSARSSSSSSFEEVTAPVGRRGKTRMPKRLVKKQAVVEMGYPFEEEEDFIIVRRALEKEHIDELIKISESYKEAEKTTYVFEDNKTTIVDPPHSHHPPPPPSQHFPPPPPGQHFAPPPPPPAEFFAPPPPASVAPSHHSHHAHHHSPSVRSPSPSSHHEVFEERIEESNHIGGPLTVLVPGHEERRIVRTTERSDRDIKEEIRMLENERRLLKYEREGDFEIIERREPKREVVRVEKDRKGKRPPNPKLVAAMMSTLT